MEKGVSGGVGADGLSAQTLRLFMNLNKGIPRTLVHMGSGVKIGKIIYVDCDRSRRE